jgi:hypothetical protein
MNLVLNLNWNSKPLLPVGSRDGDDDTEDSQLLDSLGPASTLGPAAANPQTLGQDCDLQPLQPDGLIGCLRVVPGI